jgi:hypothetical protein
VSAKAGHTALTTAVLAALGAIPVSRENVEFTKPTDAKWAALYYLPNRPTVFTLSDAGQDMGDGILQVDIHYPTGTGDEAADDDAETFRAAFKAGQKLVSGGQGVVIQSCGRSPGRLEDNWYIVSVTIGWYALISRT